MERSVFGSRGRKPGGIRGLVKLIDEHRGAFEYDWRTRFRLPLKSVGRSITWGETTRLTVILLRDPSSWVCASIRGWVSPIDREDMVLRDIFDLQHASKAKRKPRPYPRPWDVQPKKIGGASMTVAEFQALKSRAAQN